MSNDGATLGPKRGVPRSYTASGGRASIQAADGDGKKLGSFDGIAYTGAPMRPSGWGQLIIVDLEGVKYPADGNRPVFRQHDPEQIVGHTTGITVDASGIKITGVFSGERQHTDTVIVPARNGFEWQLSIGADPGRSEYLEAGETATVNGREVTGPLTIIRETDLSEISFVPLGADGDTSVSVAASNGGRLKMFKDMLKAAKAARNINAAKYSDDDIENMDEKEAKAALKKCMAEDDEKSDVDADDDEKSDVDADDDEKSDVDADDDEKSDVDADDEKPQAKAGKNRSKIGASSIRAAISREMKAARSARASEFRRQNEIVARCQKFGGNLKITDSSGRQVDLVAHAIENGWKPDRVELHALRNHRPSANTGPHFYSPSSPVMNEAVLECAVFDALRGSFRLFDTDFYRFGDDGKRRVSEYEERRITAELNSRYSDQVRQAAHTHFRGRIGFQQLLTTLAAANGYRGPATFNDPGGWGEVAAYLSGQIRADGPSSVNTPATLANVQNKFLLQGYLFTEQSFLDVSSILPVKDLKPTKSVQLFGDFQFRPLNPSGEIQHASVGDNPYENQASIQARMLTLNLQYIINDDLNAFGQLPMMLGRGWGLRVNDLIWSKYLQPGTDDGGSTDFYATTHTIAGQQAKSNLNTGTGSALSSSSLQTAKQMFDKQVDPAGYPLGVDAELLVYPPELDVPALELMNSQFIVMAGLASTSAGSKQPNTNIWKGRFKPVMSRYLSNSAYAGSSATAWYLQANPSVLPVIQIAALNGQMTPVIQTSGQDWQFNMLGISMRGWGGVGVEKQNFRGAVKSAGA